MAAVALVFALGLPALANHFVNQGKYSWWAAGLGLVLTIGLSAPMPQTAGEALTKYGHWPATTVAELADWAPDGNLVGINNFVASTVGGLLHPGDVEVEGPKKLGSEEALGAPAAGDQAPATDAEPATDQAEPGADQPVETPSPDPAP